MTLRCGIVGLPNVGKSTLWGALTGAAVAAENYPFCTIEPNAGVVAAPDPRLAALNQIVQAPRVMAAAVEFTDIAGLVRGASKGEGLGNQFLGHIRETAALIHVVRCFDDADITHVDGAPNPARDCETIATELALADLETLEKRRAKAARAARTAEAEARAHADFLHALHAHVAAGKPAGTFDVPPPHAQTFRECFLLSAKPALYVANVDEDALAKGNAHTRALESYARQNGGRVLRLCAKMEMELNELPAEERAEYLAAFGATEAGLPRLIRAARELLRRITFLTAGPKEVRAWDIPLGARAPQAAGAIHSDFERTFIRAEIIPFADFVECGGEAGAKAAGKMRVEGREYVMQDGDVAHFRTGG